MKCATNLLHTRLHVRLVHCNRRLRLPQRNESKAINLIQRLKNKEIKILIKYESYFQIFLHVDRNQFKYRATNVMYRRESAI